MNREAYPLLSQGNPVNEEYLGSCRFLQYDPGNTSEATHTRVLTRLNQCFGHGITKTELRQILRRCKVCRNLMFVDRCYLHRCDGAGVGAKDPGFDFISCLRSLDEHRGFTHQDLKLLLATCLGCDRITLAAYFLMHSCQAQTLAG